MNLTRKLVFALVGLASYPFLAWVNRLHIVGAGHLRGLPSRNVLFVCNHQTYFADVIALLHIFCATNWGRTTTLGLPSYLLNPFTGVTYVAAEQTMKSTWLARFFTLGGAVTVKRAWTAGSREGRTGLDSCGTRKITRTLADNWVITFPQGTTTAFAPGRKGTALIIKQSRPIVIPVVIEGFGRAFEKQRFYPRETGVRLVVKFKAPLAIDYDAPTGEILEQIMTSIEQNKGRERDAEASLAPVASL